MEGIAARLDGVAGSVAFIEWPDAPDHGDAADFVQTYAAADVPLLPQVRTPGRRRAGGLAPSPAGGGRQRPRGARWPTFLTSRPDR